MTDNNSLGVIQKSLNEILRGLGTVEGTLNSMREEFGKHIADDREDFDELAKRISSVEHKMWSFGGVISAGSLMVGVFGTALFKKLGILS